jgi:hypothetical protein
MKLTLRYVSRALIDPFWVIGAVVAAGVLTSRDQT